MSETYISESYVHHLLNDLKKYVHDLLADKLGEQDGRLNDLMDKIAKVSNRS